MTNKNGEKIKFLRKHADITQEKLGEHLGITFQAVSRWESGLCYPDLEMLPAIANYFNVTTDELLSVDILRKQEKLDAIENQIRINYSKGLIDENIEICRAALNEFPNDYSLLRGLAIFLWHKNNTSAEAIAICERILADCTDDKIRIFAIQTLANAYNASGDKEKAKETASKLPHFPFVSDVHLADILSGEERIDLLQRNIQNFCEYIAKYIRIISIMKYVDEENPDDMQKRILLCEKAIMLYQLIYENGDYGLYHTRLCYAYLEQARNFICLDEQERALDCIESAAEHVVTFDTLPDVFVFSSAAFAGRVFKTGDVVTDTTDNESKVMLHSLLSNDAYVPLRNCSRFIAVVVKLKKYAN